jgi:hypothetical protein
MAVGLPLKTTYADGDVYSASDVNDTNGTINLTAAPYAAGKNKIINGAFNVWQRGTSAAVPSNTSAFLADRFFIFMLGTYSATQSQQTFTPGTAPVSGYESQYFWRNTISSITGTLDFNRFGQRIEDVRTFAGQTVTVSFWAKAGASASWTPKLFQEFGSGGSSTVVTNGTAVSITTSWTRFTQTFTVPSISGKTVGAGSMLSFIIDMPLTGAQTNDVWGVQVEQGSTATAFQTASGTIQGELALCQRYYYRQTGPQTLSMLSNAGWGSNSAQYVYSIFNTPVSMRSAPTSLDWANVTFGDGSNWFVPTTMVITTNYAGNNLNLLEIYYAAGGLVQFRPYWIRCNNNTAAYLGVSAEL